MTVSYTQHVATAKFGLYFKLLFRWKGSIYKLIWKDIAFFLFMYYLLRTIYRRVLNEEQRRIFEDISEDAKTYSAVIPLSFVLGFYMQVVFQRWLTMFDYLTWPDRMALFVTACIKGLDERGRLMRRTIIRYMIVGYIMNQRSICPRVKRRFPTLNHLTQAGLLTAQEERIIENIPQTRVNKYVIPFLWTVNVIALARREGRIYDDYTVSVLTQELLQYRIGLGKLLLADSVGIPLVYTQSVTLAVHMFVLFTLFGRQFHEQREDGGAGDEDQYVHLGALLQFFLYMGWLKLAEMMINPFGDDDDDFDMNVLIDRNLQYCYLVVDDLHSDIPPLVKDMYWNRNFFHLPYTKASGDRARDINTEIGSAYQVVVPEDKSDFVTTLDDAILSARRRKSSSVPLRRLSMVQSQKRCSVQHHKPPLNPQEESKVTGASGLPPGATEGYGLSSTVKLKRTLSAISFTNSKKFFESAEQMFHTSEGIPEISNPFDNRFQEVDYKDPVKDRDKEIVEETSKVHPDAPSRMKRISSMITMDEIRRAFGRESPRSQLGVEQKGLTASVLGTSSSLTFKKSVTHENPPQVPPPPPPSPHEDPPQSELPSQSGKSWYLPK